MIHMNRKWSLRSLPINLLFRYATNLARKPISEGRGVGSAAGASRRKHHRIQNSDRRHESSSKQE